MSAVHQMNASKLKKNINYQAFNFKLKESSEGLEINIS